MSLLLRSPGSRSHHQGAGPLLFSALGLIAGDPFIVALGSEVVIDVDTPSLGATSISGKVRDNGTPRTLTTSGITVNDGGVLQIGTAATPFAASSPFTINLTGAYQPLVNTVINNFTTPTTADASNRGIMVMPGGTLDLHGTPPATLYTTLGASAAAAATSLTLAASTAWAVGDPVVIAQTDFVDYDSAEQFTLSAISGAAATLSSGLVAARYGVLQYPTDAGWSLTSGTFSTQKASVDVPTVLDERARVANLARNIVVTCPSDTDWSNKGHGVVIMAMASSGLNQATMRLEGVQVRRGGQRGALGRYPIHWHINSYNSATGAFTSDATQSYVRKCVVWDSENRAYTIHGTCGVELTDNIAYNVKGHAFFLEDGSERRNTILRNMAFKTNHPNAPTAGVAITSISGDGTTATVNATAHGLYSGSVVTVASASIAGFNLLRAPVTVITANQFTYPCTTAGTPSGATYTYGNDRVKVHDGTASGFWITNLDNTIEDNYSSGNASGHGAWIALSSACFGLSAKVAIAPDAIKPISLKGFTCHSNFGFGLRHSQPNADEAGNTLSPGSGNKYPNGGDGTFFSTDHRLWKNGSGAYHNVTNIPRYQRWVVADNGEMDWSGNTNNGGTATDHLGIGISFNNAHTTPLNDINNYYGAYGRGLPRAAFVSYHGTVNFSGNSWFNYAYEAFYYQTNGGRPAGGGVTQGGVDFYDVCGVDRTNGLNTNNRFINSHPGGMVPPNHLDGRSVDANAGAQRHYSFSSAWLDIDGKYGTAGKYMLPFSKATALVDDYFLSGATNLADGPTTGTVVCKTTDTKFMATPGSGQAFFRVIWAGTPVNDVPTHYVVAGDMHPVTVTRQNLTTGATIGTPYMVKRGDTSGELGTNRSVVVQVGGRFQFDFSEVNVFTMTIASPAVVTYVNTAKHGLTAGRMIVFSTTGALPTGVTAGTPYYVIATGLTTSAFQFSATVGGSAINTSGTQSGVHSYTFTLDPPDSMLVFDVPSPAPAVGDFVLFGLPWANASTPRICVGNTFSNENVAGLRPFGLGNNNTFASAADVTAGRAIIPSTAATGATDADKLAAVLADTTGMTYWQDTTNNRIWIRYTNRNSSGAAFTANGFVFGVDIQTIVVKV